MYRGYRAQRVSITTICSTIKPAHFSHCSPRLISAYALSLWYHVACVSGCRYFAVEPRDDCANVAAELNAKGAFQFTCMEGDNNRLFLSGSNDNVCIANAKAMSTLVPDAAHAVECETSISKVGVFAVFARRYQRVECTRQGTYNPILGMLGFGSSFPPDCDEAAAVCARYATKLNKILAIPTAMAKCGDVPDSSDCWGGQRTPSNCYAAGSLGWIVRQSCPAMCRRCPQQPPDVDRAPLTPQEGCPLGLQLTGGPGARAGDAADACHSLWWAGDKEPFADDTGFQGSASPCKAFIADGKTTAPNGTVCRAKCLYGTDTSDFTCRDNVWVGR